MKKKLVRVIDLVSYVKKGWAYAGPGPRVGWVWIEKGEKK